MTGQSERYFECDFCGQVVQGQHASQDVTCCPEQTGHAWTEIDGPHVDIVGEGAACPECGQNRVDYLVWINDDYVTCTSCGCTYSL